MKLNAYGGSILWWEYPSIILKKWMHICFRNTIDPIYKIVSKMFLPLSNQIPSVELSVIIFYNIVLLAKAMDPPDPNVIDDALKMLLSIRALRKSPRGRYEPTFYGRLLASFPLSFDACILVVKFGEMGMLREGILLGVLMDTQPLPIHHPFGDDSLVCPIGRFIYSSARLFDHDVNHPLHLCLLLQFLEYVDHYFGGSKTICSGRREMVLMANFCAFQFWQRVFKVII